MDAEYDCTKSTIGTFTITMCDSRRPRVDPKDLCDILHSGRWSIRQELASPRYWLRYDEPLIDPFDQ